MPQIAVYVKQVPYEILRKLCNKQKMTESQIIYYALVDYFALYADTEDYKKIKKVKA